MGFATAKREVKDKEILSYLVKKEEKRHGFAWKKKIERDIAEGSSLGVYSAEGDKKRQRQRSEEMKKLKKRKEEREIQKAQHEEERNLLARERARAEFDDWEKKEKEFDFHQIKVKSEIRVREGRAKPIDKLMNMEMNEEQFMKIFKGLSLKDMEEVIEEMKLLSEFDRENPARIQYWESLSVICEWELLEAKNKDAFKLRRMHSSIEDEVTDFLHGKSHIELEAIQSQIESKMRSGEAEVVEFWEELIRLLPIFKARAFIKETCATVVPSNLNLLEENQKAELEDDTSKEEVDEQLGSDDEIDLNLRDRCQLRKPKYSNIVHSAYEWTKYNRVHYDNENKPPKIVQGYKFNILYPDLVDKSKTPNYVIEADGDGTSTCIIRFTAGPPYQDIAFRIVNRDIEKSRKKGFRATFDGGILRLYFYFKRYSYRR